MWGSIKKAAGIAVLPASTLARQPNVDNVRDAEDHDQASAAAADLEKPHGDQMDLEKDVLRKLDRNIMPIVFVLYLLAFLDRSNIGNARIAGLTQDLDLYGNRYTWLLNIFYISYILAQPAILVMKVLPPHMWTAFLVFGWGLLASVQAGVVNWSGEMAIRFLLGAFEAAYGPGIIYLLSFFYLRRELGLRCGVFVCAAPLSTTFAGALAYGITSGHAKIANWRLLFLVEGLPTVVMAPIVWFLLPDSPRQCRFLNEREKEAATRRGVRQAGGEMRIGSLNFKDAGLTLLDLKAWLTALMYFSTNVSYASLPVFLPTILEDMGFTAINAQGLSAPPYFIAFFVTLISTWIADRTQQRGYVLMSLSAIGGIGYVILAATENVGARYFATFLAAGGVFPSIANISPWVMNNQGSDTRRGMGIVLLNLIGQCGPLLGSNIYPTADAPRYVKGQSVCAAFMFLTTLLALGLRVLLVWENKKLDRKWGARESTDAELDRAGEENYGPSFRYVL